MNNKIVIKKTLAICLATLLALATSLVSEASQLLVPTGAAPGNKFITAASPSPGPTDPAELESFLDDLMARQMEEHHIAGAAVSVVKDGELFFAKGYGYADLERHIPVDPEQTIFRIGSVTKLITWTAVMQLVEQGKLDLDADINTYLDFHIPDTYPQPITLKHLLTHTAGFEDLFIDFLVIDEKDQTPWRGWLVSHMPARVRPPGDCAAYSNYGTSLAAYIVERVSGQPYDQYVQEHILNPLGMTHTTVQTTMPPALRPLATVGYTYKNGAFQVFPYYTGHQAIIPVGGMASSATDMARFMIAHLENGLYRDVHINETRILQENTAKRMHGTLFTHDPRLLGTAYGFFDFSDNGQRTIGHNGEAMPIHTLLLLLPDRDLGVFVTYNSDGGADLADQHLGFQRAFFDHYFPAPPVEPIQPPPDFAQRAGRFTGSYRMMRSSYTTLEKCMGLFGALAMEDPGDGTLLLKTPWGNWRFVEVAPLFFRQVDTPFHISFREDARGQITHMFTDYTPMFGFEKLRWYETPAFNQTLALACVLVFLSVIVEALIRLLRKRRPGESPGPDSRGARAARWTIVGISVLNLLFVAGTVLWGDPKPLFGVSLVFKIVLGLGVCSAVMTIIALIYAMTAWKNGYWGRTARGHYTLATAAAAAFVWFLNYWNLLGWRF